MVTPKIHSDPNEQWWLYGIHNLLSVIGKNKAYTLYRDYVVKVA